MKSVRRRLKKRSRARTVNELEEAFFDLVTNYNILVRAHWNLRDKVDVISTINETKNYRQ